MKIGAHLSTSQGILKNFHKAQELGINCFQIFASSPRMWRVKGMDGSITLKFRHQLKVSGLNSSFIHIKYLVNLVSPDMDVQKKSILATIEELNLGSELGLSGAMFHIGSHKQQDRISALKILAKNIKLILKESSPRLIYS